MENKQNFLEFLGSDKVKFGIGLAVIILVAGLFLFYFGLGNKDDGSKTNEPVAQENQIEELDADADLVFFPTDFLSPTSAEIVKNVRVTSPEGQVQVTKLLESPKSVDENFSFFQSNFDKNDRWQMIATSEENPVFKSLVAEDAGGTMHIFIEKGQPDDITFLNMSYVLNLE